MTREADIDVLAEALCASMHNADPDDGLPWTDLHDDGRAYYRKRIKDLLLNEEPLIRLVFCLYGM